MEQRTIIPLLMTAAAFCFEPATSNYIRYDREGTKQDPGPEPSCLQKALATNYLAVDSVIEFLCSYMKNKNMTNKEELITALDTLKDITDCSTEDIFGSDASLEQVAVDENGILTSQIITMEQLLSNHVLLPITSTVCALLDCIEKSPDPVAHSSKGEVQGKKRTARNILGLVGGLTGALDGLGGLLNLLGLVGKLVKFLEPITNLLGNVLDGLSGVTNLVGGLGNGVTGLLGGLTGGILGGGQKQGDLLGNVLGGVGDTLGGLTGGLGGLTGGLTGGLLGGGGGGSNILGLLGR